MTEKVCYWDADAKEQRERDETPEETAERLSRKNATPAVPQSVPMLNAHLILIGSGWMPAVRAYLDALPGAEGEQARVYFDKALTMRRDHPLVLGIPAAIGKTEAEVDALFLAAGALDV